jgi:CDP-diacylglycerol--glycerol-3-phosphate 3-phosphatidyltransferase
MRTLDLVLLLIAAAVLATVPAFAIGRRGRPLDPDVAARPRTVLLGRGIRDWLMWLVDPLVGLCARAGLPPLAFNVAGALLGLAAGTAYGFGAFAVAGWLVLLGGAADVFDGRIARARGLASRSGAFLDSTLDRFAETFAYAGLVIRFGAQPWRALAAALALGGSLLVSYARARGEGLGISYRGGLMQRAERLVLLALASLLDPAAAAVGWPRGRLLALALAAIAAGSLGTALQRTAAIARALEREDARR